MRPRSFALAALIAAGTPVLALAATPAPKAAAPAPAHTLPARISIESLTPKNAYPTVVLHTSLLIGVNRKGQVVNSRFEQRSKSDSFNTQTFGNSLQMFIRTPDGNAISGMYRVTYDYDPKRPLDRRIRRNVSIVHPGGVDPNATGAADVMMAEARRNGQRAAAAQKAKSQKQAARTAAAAPAGRMPDLPQVMTSPSH